MSSLSEDNSWVFDSLVCFLHGPIWNAPLQTFIEEKSLIFDPNLTVDETNSEYKKIHEEYKNLVDYMLASFMDEMTITPEQFEIACLEGRNQHQPNDGAFTFHQGLFQQIWAANDIRIFIRMMTQRNVELQLQALDLIERHNSSTTSSLDEEISAEVSEKDNAVALADTSDVNNHVLRDSAVSEKLKESKHSPERQSNEKDSSEQDKFQRLNLFFDNEKITSEDIRSRQEYLRAQRDKILQIKKLARARQLNETAKKGGRPTSAQAAQKILQGNAEEVIQREKASSSSTAVNNDAFQLRKALAKRLRSEVVEQ